MIERQEERLHPHLEGRPWRGDASLVPFLRAEALGYAACYRRDARNEHSFKGTALGECFRQAMLQVSSPLDSFMRFLDYA